MSRAKRIGGEKGLVIDAIKSSVDIVRLARRRGYLDEDLKPTGKAMNGAISRNYSWVKTPHDIFLEIEFLTGGAAKVMVELAGMDPWALEGIQAALIRCVDPADI